MIRCFYCAESFERGPDHPPEHILPAAIEADLTTDRVCQPCNTWAGEHVDQPWLRHPAVEELRFRNELRDRRGRVLKSPKLPIGKLEDGEEAIVWLTVDGVVIRRKPLQFSRDDGTIVLRNYTDEELDKAVERIRREEPNARLVRQQAVDQLPLTATVTWDVDIHVWPRFAAKVALGLFSLSADDSWLDTEVATQLRDVLRNGYLPNVNLGNEVFAQPGMNWSAVPALMEPGPDNGVLPPGHLLMVTDHPDGERRHCSMTICGQAWYVIPVGPPTGEGRNDWWRFER